MAGIRNYETGLYKELEKLNEKLDKLISENKSQSLTIYDLKSTIKNLQKESKKDKETIQKLLLEIERLKNNNNKNSNNSGKPSSTNGFKKVVINNREKSNKKQGGQKNHKGTTLTKDDIDIMIKNGEIEEIIEVEENKTENNKYLTPIITYEYDVKIIRTVIKHIIYPENATNIISSPVYYGNNIKSICNILGMKYMSIDGIKSFIWEATKINLSKGTIYSWNKQIAQKLSETEYETIKEKLLNSLVLHVDETPIKINGKQYYVHNISNGTHTLQYIGEKRGEVTIKEFGFLKEYQGILIHDHFIMYYNYGIDNAECNVHILRYLNGVCEFTNHTWSKIMKEFLLKAKDKKDSLIEQNYESMSKDDYNTYKNRYLEIISLGKEEYKKDFKTNAYAEDELKLLNRMEKYVHNHLLFLEKFYVPFSNNQAEADLRGIKIKQKIGKFRSIDGADAYIKTKSCISTYNKNDISTFKAITSLLNEQAILV